MIVPFGFGLPGYKAHSRMVVRLATKGAGSPRPPSRRGRLFRLRGTVVSPRGGLRCRRGLLFGPAERLAGDQHAMQDHRQLARQRHAGLLVAGPLLDPPRPVLQWMSPAHHPSAGCWRPRRAGCAAWRRRASRYAPSSPSRPTASAAMSARHRRPQRAIWRTARHRRQWPRRPAPLSNYGSLVKLFRTFCLRRAHGCLRSRHRHRGRLAS